MIQKVQNTPQHQKFGMKISSNDLGTIAKAADEKLINNTSVGNIITLANIPNTKNIVLMSKFENRTLSIGLFEPLNGDKFTPIATSKATHAGDAKAMASMVGNSFAAQALITLREVTTPAKFKKAVNYFTDNQTDNITKTDTLSEILRTAFVGKTVNGLGIQDMKADAAQKTATRKTNHINQLKAKAEFVMA